jgi:MFS family permease
MSGIPEATPIVLTAEERTELEGLARSTRTEHRLRQRSGIVLMAAAVVGGFADLLPRRAFLVAMDFVRAGIALLLPFVTEVSQVYVLIFLLQSASAAFTPTFQATIPDVLPEEREYTRALSLSRLAYDLENLLSPMLAAALLSVMSFHWLFAGTVADVIAYLKTLER